MCLIADGIGNASLGLFSFPCLAYFRGYAWALGTARGSACGFDGANSLGFLFAYFYFCSLT
jgi:hypothetical protein